LVIFTFTFLERSKSSIAKKESYPHPRINNQPPQLNAVDNKKVIINLNYNLVINSSEAGYPQVSEDK